MPITAEQYKAIIAEKLPAGLVIPEHTEDAHFYRNTLTTNKYGSVTAKANVLDTPRLKQWAAKIAVEYLDAHWNEITPENRPMFLDKAIHEHVKLFEDAGITGNQGHGIIDVYLKAWIEGNKLPDIRDVIPGDPQRDTRLLPVFAACRSAELFAKEFDVIPVASELKLISERYKFGGTLDSLMMVRRLEQDSVFTEYCPPGSNNHLFGVDVHNPNRQVCAKCAKMFIHELCIVDWKTSNTIDKVEYAMQTAAYRRALWEMTGIKVKHILIVKLDKKYAKYEVMRVRLPAEAFRMFMHSAKLHDWLENGEEKLTPLGRKKMVTL